jgi:hypothetical protein
MRLTGHLRIGIAVVLTGWVAPYSAGAETKLTEFNGIWRGIGTDRSSPFDGQRTNCQNTIRAHPSDLSSHMICHGQAGLHKVIDLQVTLNGDQCTGTLSQNTSGEGRGAPCRSELKGSVSGRRVGDTASFQVEFPEGVCSHATVDLEFNGSRRSYHLRVTTRLLIFTGTVMDVNFTRAAPP